MEGTSDAQKQMHPVKTADGRYVGPVTLDREFPDPFVRQKQNRWYFVTYGVGVVIACAIIFNYEKTTSPLITSTFFILRRSQVATELLGPTIGYSLQWPWISGPLNTVQGRVDISFAVKGEKSEGTIYLKAARESKQHPFVFERFALVVDGKEHDLTKDPAIEFAL